MSQWLCQTSPLLSSDEDQPQATLATAQLDPKLRHALESLAEFTELPLFCYEANSGLLVWQSEPELLPCCPIQRRMRLAEVTEPEILAEADGLAYTLFPWEFGPDQTKYVISGYCLTQTQARPNLLILEGIAADWQAHQIEHYFQSLPVCSERMLGNVLQLAMQTLRQQAELKKAHQTKKTLERSLHSRSEAVDLLHELVHKLQVLHSAEELAVECVKRLHLMIGATGHAICLQATEDHVEFLVEGRLPFDETTLARLLSRFDHHDWTKPLIKNQLQKTLLGADFPGLKSLIVAPIGDGASRRGWVLSVNANSPQEFQTIDAELLAAVAAILCTHVRNVEIFDQHEELLVSFIRSLVTTLDAKDPYTRGHSERVALIARKLGEYLNLPESDLNDIYLSGLLHDLGKIGVDDRILRKPDQLTDEEFQHIQQHPLIGYQILSQLKSLHQILPGVRSHHESFNGKGYPDRLRGDEIPLMARIIAVADAYDAMCSNRPYRQGIPVEKLEEIFRRGSGEQWDARVIEAYFSVRDEILDLCAKYSPTDGNLLKDRTSERSAGITVRTFLRY